MATDRGPKLALGVTLILCGAALFFLVIHRQAEMFAPAAPPTITRAAVVRALMRRASLDVETLGEAFGSLVLLVAAGALLAARPHRVRPKSSTLDSDRFHELESRVSRAEAEKASLRARLSEAEAVNAQTRSLLFEQRAKADREIEALNDEIESRASELAFVASPARRENGGPSISVLAPPEPARVAPSAFPAALETVTLPAPIRTPSSNPPRRSSKSELRRDLRFAAHVEVDFESDSHFYTGLSENLSEGGLFVATYAPRPIGSEIDLTLKLPGHAEPMRTRATVRWIRNFSEESESVPGMGLRLHLEDEDLPRIRRFLSTRPPLFFDDG